MADFGRQEASDDEEDFEYGDELSSSGSPQKAGATVVANKPHDEEIALSDSESVDDHPEPRQQQQMQQLQGRGGDSPPQQHSENGGSYNSDDDNDASQQRGGPGNAGQRGDSDSSSEEEDDDDTVGGGGGKGYNPSDYANLNVSQEIKELFQYIGRYKPQPVELETPLKPFVPDYIPAVGDIDAFLKIPRPDGAPDNLGLICLDEPAPNQSDPTVLEMQFRATSKQSNITPMTVRSIENADKNPKAIAAWISSINEMHRSKPPTNVNYTKNMPDIESLMQVWPAEFEEILQSVKLPTAELDVDLSQYARLVCAILDIPVYNNIVESLHVLFTLYSEFKTNQHFHQQDIQAL